MLFVLYVYWCLKSFSSIFNILGGSHHADSFMPQHGVRTNTGVQHFDIFVALYDYSREYYGERALGILSTQWDRMVKLQLQSNINTQPSCRKGRKICFLARSAHPTASCTAVHTPNHQIDLVGGF